MSGRSGEVAGIEGCFEGNRGWRYLLPRPVQRQLQLQLQLQLLDRRDLLRRHLHFYSDLCRWQLHLHGQPEPELPRKGLLAGHLRHCQHLLVLWHLQEQQIVAEQQVHLIALRLLRLLTLVSAAVVLVGYSQVFPRQTQSRKKILHTFGELTLRRYSTARSGLKKAALIARSISALGKPMLSMFWTAASR